MEAGTCVHGAGTGHLTVHMYTCSDTWVERTEACHVMRGTDKEILGTREIFALFLSESLMYYL